MKRILIIGSPRHSKALMRAIASLTLSESDIIVRSNRVSEAIDMMRFTHADLAEAGKALSLAIENFGKNINELSPILPAARSSPIPQKFQRGKNNFRKK